MTEHIAEITRTLRVALPGARDDDEAAEMALAIAWQWLPDQAEGGDYGSAEVRIVRSGDLPGGGSSKGNDDD